MAIQTSCVPPKKILLWKRILPKISAFLCENYYSTFCNCMPVHVYLKKYYIYKPIFLHQHYQRRKLITSVSSIRIVKQTFYGPNEKDHHYLKPKHQVPLRNKKESSIMHLQRSTTSMSNTDKTNNNYLRLVTEWMLYVQMCKHHVWFRVRFEWVGLNKHIIVEGVKI